MNSRQERVQVLYEISLAIGRGDSLTETAREALSAYLRKLNCSAGAILTHRTGPDDTKDYEQVATIPSQPRVTTGYRRAIEWIQGREDPPLPEVLTVDEDTSVYLLSLPGFGVLVLITSGAVIEEGTVGALGALNQKLADVCRAEQMERELRVQRDRFEAAVETVPEPMVHVVTHEGNSVVRGVNSTFETTFGCDHGDAQGATLTALLTSNVDERDTPVNRGGSPPSGGGSPPTDWAGSDSDRESEVVNGGQRETAGRDVSERPSFDAHTEETPTDTPRDPDTSWVTKETSVEREVRRQTVDGERVFKLQTIPVPSPDQGNEQFGLYVDVTDQRRRQRTLERLYQAAREFFDFSDRAAVCQRAVQTAAEVLNFSTCGVHLYDRETEALEPVATTGLSDIFEETDAASYADPDTIVWEVYQTGEPAIVSDTESFAGQLPNGDTPVRSGLVLPLGSHGVFVTSSRVPNSFDDSDQYFGKLLARMLQTALDRTERERSLQSVQSATRSLVTADDAEAVAEELTTHTVETIDAPYVGIWRYDPKEQLLRPVTQTPASEELLERTPVFQPGNSIAWEVFRDGEPQLVNHVATVEGAYNRNSQIQSEIIIPIGSYGVLTAGSKLPNDFSQEEFELLQTLTTSAESALQIIRKQQELDVLDEVLARILRHNVRNDLNVIRGRGEIIADSGPSDCVDHAERIVETANKILSTAASATEIREVVDNHGASQTVQIDNLVESVADGISETYPEATITTGEFPKTELAVHPQFEYAVRHAIENAVEHHEDDTDPRVEVRVASLERGVVIEVEDEGPGLPESEIEPLLAGEETRLVHGSGAGLWILDRVVQYSGGAVEFDTGEDGTTVRMIVDKTAASQ